MTSTFGLPMSARKRQKRYVMGVSNMPKKFWVFLAAGVLFGCAAPTTVIQTVPEKPPSENSAVPANERERDDDDEFDGLHDLQRLVLAPAEQATLPWC